MANYDVFRTTTALNGDFITEMPKLTRVEVIDHSPTGHGRAWGLSIIQAFLECDEPKTHSAYYSGSTWSA